MMFWNLKDVWNLRQICKTGRKKELRNFAAACFPLSYEGKMSSFIFLDASFGVADKKLTDHLSFCVQKLLEFVEKYVWRRNRVLENKILQSVWEEDIRIACNIESCPGRILFKKRRSTI